MILEDDLGSEFVGDGLTLFSLSVDAMSPNYPVWLNDPEVSRFLLGDRSIQTHTTCASFVTDCRANPAVLLLGIRVLLDGFPRHVGNVKFSAIRPEHGTAEIGILIGERELWGYGLGHRALLTAKSVAKERLLLRKLTAGILASNVGSQRAFAKAGFTTIGARSRQFILEGVPEDELLTECFL